MALIVQKFGGTSVADMTRICHVAELVDQARKEGDDVVVVVSAMAGVTDQLSKTVHALDPSYYPASIAEQDVVLSTGEQVTAGLLALALQQKGISARSWLGWQLECFTQIEEGQQSFTSMDVSAIHANLAQGIVPIIAGFQGVNAESRITTIGRGGSDLSAVALAVFLQADRCDIYTDVEGVYTADPRLVLDAKPLHSITYEEMLEMAYHGSRVMQARSVKLAQKHGVMLRVLSSFNPGKGTLIMQEDAVCAIRPPSTVTGIAHQENEAKITLRQIPDDSDLIHDLFETMIEAGIWIGTMVQSVSTSDQNIDLVFTVLKVDLERAIGFLKTQEVIPFRSIVVDEDVAKITVVGLGLKHHPGIAYKLFKTLERHGVHIEAMHTSDMVMNILIAEQQLQEALCALHKSYRLHQMNEDLWTLSANSGNEVPIF